MKKYLNEEKEFHSFNIKIAIDYGIEEAILINHIVFWIQKNVDNNKNFHSGHTWTFNTRKAFNKQFPYLTENKIRYTLDKLIEKGEIITGNFNKSTYDRTIWYALNDESKWGIEYPVVEDSKNEKGEKQENFPFGKIPKWKCENSQMDLGKSSNGFGKIPKSNCENSQSIPYTIPNSNSDSEKDTEHFILEKPKSKSLSLGEFISKMEKSLFNNFKIQLDVWNHSSFQNEIKKRLPEFIDELLRQSYSILEIQNMLKEKNKNYIRDSFSEFIKEIITQVDLPYTNK